MKIRKSKERANEVFVTIKSTEPEGSAQFVYEKLIELVEKENRLRKKEGRRALGYTIQMEGPEDWKAQEQAEPTQGDTEAKEREERWEWISVYWQAKQILEEEKIRTVIGAAVFVGICLVTILIHMGLRVL